MRTDFGNVEVEEVILSITALILFAVREARMRRAGL